MGVVLFLCGLEMLCEVELVGDCATVLHFVLTLILRQLVHNCLLNSFLFFTYTGHLFIYVRMLHFVLTEPEYEVV